ncbi:DUF6223 family protein [Saccharopolyspora sp. NPDC002686]|uniref:DUF6223 family protein n=1 Tax=Saccharopolyspora sp. NPDC002686 TaxID=3154541 RepID=UPI00332D39AA
MSLHLLADTAQQVSAYTMTPGRFWSAIAALVGLGGAVIGGLALVRPTKRTGTGAAALAAGLSSMVVGGFVVASAEGGPGTGYGIVGGYLDLVVGLVAAVLGWLAVARSRRAA